MNEVVVFVHESAVLHAVIQLLDEQESLLVHQVSAATDVLEKVNSSSIILTDLLAPDARGLELLERIQHEQGGAAVPVIVLTSAKNEQLAVQALRGGATSYVPSRLVSSELLGTMSSVFAVANAHQSRSRIMDCLSDWSCQFVLDNDRTLIAPLVRYLQDMTQQMGLIAESGEETRIGIALEEAILNGIYHGNLEVASALREEDEAKFHALIEKRRKEKPYCDRRLRIQSQFRRGEGVFIIQDEGPGFDISTVPDPTDPVNMERTCGRGMLLMRTFMDELRYNKRGNQVRLVKRRPIRDSS